MGSPSSLGQHVPEKEGSWTASPAPCEWQGLVSYCYGRGCERSPKSHATPRPSPGHKISTSMCGLPAWIEATTGSRNRIMVSAVACVKTSIVLISRPGGVASVRPISNEMSHGRAGSSQRPAEGRLRSSSRLHGLAVARSGARFGAYELTMFHREGNDWECAPSEEMVEGVQKQYMLRP